MNSYRGFHLLRSSSLLTTLALGFLVVGGCDLNVENPNAPDAPRAFADPAGLAKLLSGAFRTWVGTRGSYFGALPMTAIADNYSASWNNAAIRYYNSVGVDCPSRCGWNNSATAPEAAGGPTVEGQWYGYYTVLASANNVLLAVKDGLCFDDDCTVDNTITSRNTAIAKMLQGMALAGIAMVYDQGFIIDENTPPNDPSAIPFSTRAETRDAALQKFEEAYTEAGAVAAGWDTDAEWAGVGAGRTYTNTEIRQVIRTMQAELVAMWPRNAAENAAADWASVTSYASQGVSSGASFDWEYFVDITGRECGDLDCVKTWGNSIGTMRVDTRVAALITTNHVTPWPEPAGNPCPTTSADLRVGDGSYGPADDFNGYATLAATANAGTDFACSGVPIFPSARGDYHQSNLQHIRYEYLAYRGENLPASDGTGQDPFYTRQMNDLLWAEGLLRSGGSAAQAATLINNSRVGRGGLPTLTGAETVADLLLALQYEQEIEFMGQGPTPFFNRRRIDGFTFNSRTGLNDQTGTPRHMPVPAREMDVLKRSIYTFGGPSAPEMVSRTGGGVDRGTVRETVGQIWEEYLAMQRAMSRRRN